MDVVDVVDVVDVAVYKSIHDTHELGVDNYTGHEDNEEGGGTSDVPSLANAGVGAGDDNK